MITASAVNELRQKTGAGMMDCKKALQEAGGDFEAAVEWLRKKGLAAAAKKAGRVAAEGLIAIEVSASGKTGALIELNSETDFVAKNDKFQILCKNVVKDFLNFESDLESFKNSKCSASGKTIQEEISENVAVIGENMSLRRAHKLSVDQGVVVNYMHNASSPSLGKIGVLVAFETNIDPTKVITLGKQIAMHIAATKPESLSVSELDKTMVEKEKAFIRDQASTSGKPEAVIEKMVEGRLLKFYEQVVLLEQLFVIDGKTRINQVLADFAKEHGGSISIKEFARFGLGEGIEKQETDLAKEVAELAGSN
ncbi:MAG: tsf [Candidatus Midichloriaceae bacterium]|jgi:elongation factor Ts|nr:tsf [Candidatus Midichloriaceae bacterium]